LSVTFSLLIGLLIWRLTLPVSPLWLDLMVLIVVGALLLLTRAAVRHAGSTRRKDASR
jgi:hypothetical protein